MFIFPSGIPSGAGGYQPAGALSFDGSADTLSRTFSDSDGTEFIFSVWVKRISFSDNDTIFSAGSSPNRDIYFFVSNKLYINLNDGSDAQLITSGVFRDPTAWCHILVSHHHGEGTASDRIKVYVNGVEPSLGTANYPSSSTYVGKFNENQVHYLGSNHGSGSENWFSGYMADPLFIDTKSIQEGDFAITDFGGFDSTTGIWMPKDVSTLSYSGNSFYLDLSNGSDIGNDVSGNNNDFTPTSMGANNIAVDSPVNSTDKEVTIYSCLDPYAPGSSGTFSNNNLTITPGNLAGVQGNIPISSGKYYWESRQDANGGEVGVYAFSANLAVSGGNQANGAGSFDLNFNGRTHNNPIGGTLATSSDYTQWAFASGDVIGVALDMDAGKIWFHKNGTYLQSGSGTSGNVGNPAAGSNEMMSGITTVVYPFVGDGTGTAANAQTVRFSSSDWSHSAPSGFSELTSTVTGIGNTTQLAILDPAAGGISERNLRVSGTGSGGQYMHGTLFVPATGDYYFEVQVTGRASAELVVGITKDGQTNTNFGGSDWNHYLYKDNGNFDDSGSQSSYGSAWQSGNERLGIRLNNGSLFFYLNGTIQNSGTAAKTGITGNYSLFAYDNGISGNEYTFKITPEQWLHAPDGVSSFSTQNLPEPTVTDPSAFYQTAIWTGNGTAIGSGGQTITFGGNSDLVPDLVWVKRRNEARNHQLYNSVIGWAKANYSDLNNEVGNISEGVTAVTSDGFTVGNNGGVNESSDTYVAWCLKAGGAPSADNTGDRTPTNNSVMKNDAAVTTSNFFAAADIYPTRMSIASHGGFAIGTYAGNSSDPQTVAHGLGAIPDIILQKQTDAAGQDWNMYHISNHAGSNDPQDFDLSLNSNGAQDDNASKWNDTAPTSGVFTVGTSSGVNGSGKTFVFYLFKRTLGLIGIGKFKGNNSADGPYIIVDDGGSGFKPAFFMLKRIDSAGDWYMIDNARSPINPANQILKANDSNVENWMGTPANFKADFLSNGVKIRSTNGSDWNGSGAEFVYLAFAKSPFALNNRAI